jgi:hypothetical protein
MVPPPWVQMILMFEKRFLAPVATMLAIMRVVSNMNSSTEGFSPLSNVGLLQPPKLTQSRRSCGYAGPPWGAHATVRHRTLKRKGTETSIWFRFNPFGIDGKGEALSIEATAALSSIL